MPARRISNHSISRHFARATEPGGRPPNRVASLRAAAAPGVCSAVRACETRGKPAAFRALVPALPWKAVSAAAACVNSTPGGCRVTGSCMFQTDLGRADTVLAALEMKRPEVAAHSRRVSAYSVRLAAQFGLADEVIETIRLGALLHDVGKMLTPLRILEKPGRPNAREWQELKIHPELGADICHRSGFDDEVVRHRPASPRAVRRERLPRQADAPGHPVHGADCRGDGHVRRADQLARLPGAPVRARRADAHRAGGGLEVLPVGGQRPARASR